MLHKVLSSARELRDRVITTGNPAAVPLEQYRVLALRLQRAEPVGSRRVLVLTSALPAEGKTLTVTNLALTLSGSYRRRVLVIEGDLRRPTLNLVFGPGGIGPAEEPRDLRLPEGLGLPHRLSQGAPRLFTLTVEDPLLDPVPLLNSQAFASLVAWGREHFDWVLIDSPPAALVPDANMLAQLADGVLLVVWASNTSRDAVQRAVATVGQDRLLGVVMNRVTSATEQPYLAYYDYGAYRR